MVILLRAQFVGTSVNAPIVAVQVTEHILGTDCSQLYLSLARNSYILIFSSEHTTP